MCHDKVFVKKEETGKSLMWCVGHIRCSVSGWLSGIPLPASIPQFSKVTGQLTASATRINILEFS